MSAEPGITDPCLAHAPTPTPSDRRGLCTFCTPVFAPDGESAFREHHTEILQYGSQYGVSSSLFFHFRQPARGFVIQHAQQ